VPRCCPRARPSSPTSRAPQCAARRAASDEPDEDDGRG
jgi:hypothetical protein